MKLQMFAVRDRATDMFGTPMFLQSRGQAIRSFTDEVNRQAEDNQLYRHPEDFDLYFMGVFSTDDGSFDACRPEQLVIGKDVAIRGGV